MNIFIIYNKYYIINVLLNNSVFNLLVYFIWIYYNLLNLKGLIIILLNNYYNLRV